MIDSTSLSDQMRVLIDQNADGIVVVNADGDIRYANPRAQSMFGRPLDALIGEPFGLPVVDGESAEITLLPRNGKPLIAELRSAPIIWDDGPSHLVNLRDVTQRKQDEQRIQRQQRELEELHHALTEAQHRERRHLAHVLHDSAAQNVTAISVHLSLLRTRLIDPSDKALETLDLIAELNREVGLCIRDQVFQLAPPVLDREGLLPALNELAARIESRFGLAVEMAIETDRPPNLETSAASSLFQATREALINAWKHAEVKEVGVRVRERRNHLAVTVADDGKGFDTRQASHPASRAEDDRSRVGGFGLLNLKRELEHHGGRCAIRSRPGAGTRVHLILPLRPEGGA